jgi:glycosyltransferase involved in cell wall biosynthesis
MDVAGGLAAIATRTPWIVSERTNSIYYARDAKHRLRRFLGRFAGAVVANSPGGAEYWNGTGVPIVVVPNAVPLAAIEAAPRDGGDPAFAELVLFVGRLDEAKNLPNFIDACAAIVRERNAVVLICGDGPLRADLAARIERAGVADSIRLLSFRDDVWSLMKRADVLVAPSWYEGHPNAVLEAIAAGCPLVVSDIPAHRAFLDESTALFAPPDDVGALTRAIGLALADRPAARERAASAKALLARWSIERVSSEYLRIYEKVVA